MTLEAIKYENGKLKILDQLLLPEKSTYISINTVDDGWQAIHSMQVRGAPAIAIVGCLSLAVELYTKTFKSLEELQCYIQKQLNYLISARPTAVNMSKAAEDIIKVIKNPPLKEKVESLKEKVIKLIESMLEKDITDNKAIGKYGAQHILRHCTVKPIKVLTHCNTGSLATAGYGTALGVIRSLYEMENLNHAYCTETRPYNQGARLTAYELVHDKIPATLICDDMVAWLMTEKGISAVVVGGDRVAANGDTANKIGTYQLAIVAHHHKIPFYVAAPSTSCDLSLQSGSEITIEERPHQEMTHLKGMAIAAPGIGCWNPAFDVTPAELITGGIITEFGVFECCDLQSELKKHLSN